MLQRCWWWKQAVSFHAIIQETFYSLSAFLIMCHFTIRKKQFSFAKRKYFVSKNEPSKKRITLGFYFKINVRKRNKSPVKEIMQSKRINSLEALSKTLIWVDSFYWSENWSSRSKGLSQGHTRDLVGAEQTGPELLPSSPVSFSITPSWLFVNINLAETVSSDSF